MFSIHFSLIYISIYLSLPVSINFTIIPLSVPRYRSKCALLILCSYLLSCLVYVSVFLSLDVIARKQYCDSRVQALPDSSRIANLLKCEQPRSIPPWVSRVSRRLGQVAHLICAHRFFTLFFLEIAEEMGVCITRSLR